jgi:hypothetical protein
VVAAWNDHGARAFLIGSAPVQPSQYRLHVDYRLDLGIEAPLLRRSGSTVPEVAAVAFTVS